MIKEEYIKIFQDKDYPDFINKYLKTDSLNRLKNITQFCGCDYTKLYNPLFKYSRYDHSLVVANMTWHFTHDKKETIVALLHDIGTPVFSHTIDYVFGDYLKQESSEIKISDVAIKDKKLIELLLSDGIKLEDLEDLSKYKILENKKPHLCTDRLDGVLHTCYIWLHTHSLSEIKEVYDNLIVLKNENNEKEIGFKDKTIAEKFTKMVYNYAMELQGNKDKYVMQYISDLIKESVKRKLIDIRELYQSKEEDIIEIFENNFKSWEIFKQETEIIESDYKPKSYFVSIDSKKRNTIPLVENNSNVYRINEISNVSNELYNKVEEYKPKKYVYIKNINILNMN